MRVDLGVASIAVQVPPSAQHSSLLGSVMHSAYRHLFEAAGERSRPPTVRRGATRIPCEPYSAPTAGLEERASDLAVHVVGAMIAHSPFAKSKVRTVLHAQCTLDQQILGSACLRIAHEHFSSAMSAATVGQLGTAGVPTAFHLASLAAESDSFICVSASDKWLAPFIRHIPGLATYADAAAACLVGVERPGVASVAVVESVVTSCRPPAFDLWRAPAQVQRESIFDHAQGCIAQLLEERHDLGRDALAIGGDGYCGDLSLRLAEHFGLRGGLLEELAPGCHLSAAAPLATLQSAVGAAVRRSSPLRALVWTATPAGHAAALLLRASPDAVATPNGWTRPELAFDPSPDDSFRSPLSR